MQKMMNLKFDAPTQTFRIETDGFQALAFSPVVELDGKTLENLKWKPASGAHVYQAKNRQGTWELKIKSKADSLEVLLSGKLADKAAEAVLTPVLFQDFPADHILVHGRKMGGCESHLLRKKSTLTLTSEFLMALTRKGHTLQLSHPLRQRDLSHMSCTTHGGMVQRLAAFTLFAPCRGKRLKADPVTLSIAADGNAQLEAWGKAQFGDRELLEVPQESGWNSWDYYRWTITEEEVLRNAEMIASDAVLSKHVKRIVIDDGWQYCYGEWEPNPLFPSGMESLAKKLLRMGFTPGLWFAPTIAEPHSRVAQLHPEMLVCGPAGVPCLADSCMERNGFLLDPTHPRVSAWWQDIFRRYAGYGFRYFKLDFLSWTIPARRFHNAGSAPGDLMRHIIEPIRKAVGPDSRILGCNFTFDAGPDVADDVRTVSDIHASWAYVKRNAVAIGARFWAHRRFWINDPDFAVCRGEETTNDPNLHRLKMLLPYVKPERTNRELAPGLDAMDSLADLSAREAETWLSLVIISGGVVNLSDNLPRLNKKGLRLLRKTVAAEKGEAGRPLDLFRSELPACWVQRTTPILHRVLLINWGDQSAVLRMDVSDLPARSLKNFWTGEPVSFNAGRIEVEIPAHGCLLAESREGQK